MTLSVPEKKPVLSWLSYSTDQVNFRSMAYFRILLASFLLIDYFLNILPNYEAFFMDSGILPLSLWHTVYDGNGGFSILTFSNAPLFHAAIQIIYVIALLAFLTGYRTKIANIVVAFILASIYWRNTFITCNVETLARSLAILAMFLPLNRYLSVDAALETQDRRRPFPLIPLVAIKIQISMIYMFAGLFKIFNYDGSQTEWLRGTAIDHALHDNFMNNALGLALANDLPYLTPPITYMVPLFQISFVFLVYSPWMNNLTRLIAILGAVVLHGSFILLMNVGFFPHVCLIYLVLLVPDEWWDWLFDRRRKRLQSAVLSYNPACAVCHKAALIRREFRFNEHTPVVPSPDRKEKSFLVRHAAFLNALLPWRTEKQQPAWANALCLVMIVVMFQYSLMTLPGGVRGFYVPPWIMRTARLLQVDEYWSIFAPNTRGQRRTVIITAELADGRKLNVEELVPLPLKVDWPSADYSLSLRWRSFLSNLPGGGDPIQHTFLEYLCRQINMKAHDPAEKALRLWLYFGVVDMGSPPENNKFVFIDGYHLCAQ